jgi:hypothetical protein
MKSNTVLAKSKEKQKNYKDDIRLQFVWIFTLLAFIAGRENMLSVTNLEKSEHVVHHCRVVDWLVFPLLCLPETDRTTCMFKGSVS